MPRLSQKQQAEDIGTEAGAAIRAWLDDHGYEVGEIIRDAVQRSFREWLDSEVRMIVERIAREHIDRKRA